MAGLVGHREYIVMDSWEAREIRIRRGGGVPPQGRHLQVNGSAWMGPDPDKEIAGQIQVNGQPSGSGSR